MHTSGLVITLTNDPRLAQSARVELAEAGPFTLGVSRDSQCAVVLEADGPHSAHDWHEWVAARPGVAAVEVVFVHWDETEAEPTHADV